MLSFAGGVLGKIASRYGAPWKWGKAAKLVGAVGKLVGTIAKAVKDIFKVGDEVRAAERDVAAVCNSFAPGTKVRLADGNAKPIEKIKLGDKVLAGDPKTGRTRAEPVVATIIGVGHKDLARITTDTSTDTTSGKHPNTITATAGHPFWTPDKQAWTNAKNLAPGDTLSALGGKTLKVLRIQRYGAYQQARNLTVAHLHTYYVQAGTTPVLVHNCPRAAGGAPGSRPGKAFTRAGKKKVWEANADANDGIPKCELCGEPLVNPRQSQRGITPPNNEGAVDHIEPQSSGGSGDPSNGSLLCRPCNSVDKNDLSYPELWELMGSFPNGGLPG